MVELGRIERPEAEGFRAKKKLYCVPSVYPIPDAPDEYSGLVDRYWDEVMRQTEKIEVAGKIGKIFCESILVRGEEGLETLGKVNEGAVRVIKKKIEEGAILTPVESEEIFGPFLDWANCLRVVRTREVFSKVLEYFSELSQKRLDHVLKTIVENLAEGEAGLLIMKDDDRAKLQFPADIEVFLVTPPSHDDILRWIREKLKDVGAEG